MEEACHHSQHHRPRRKIKLSAAPALPISRKTMALTMEEWVMNDMYEGLLKMPLWVLSAFGSLKDGDKLCTGDVRLELIIWLVVQSMNKCPPQFYDNDYRHEWKTAPYIPLVKQAVKSARESLKHDTKTPP